MGTMDHANYAKHYETARWELFRSINVPYDQIEESVVMYPVISMKFKFIKTTSYDELLTIKTRLKVNKGVRISFQYKTYNTQNELINDAETDLAFEGMDNWRPCPPPDFLLEAIRKNSIPKDTQQIK